MTHVAYVLGQQHQLDRGASASGESSAGYMKLTIGSNSRLSRNTHPDPQPIAHIDNSSSSCRHVPRSGLKAIPMGRPSYSEGTSEMHETFVVLNVPQESASVNVPTSESSASSQSQIRTHFWSAWYGSISAQSAYSVVRTRNGLHVIISPSTGESGRYILGWIHPNFVHWVHELLVGFNWDSYSTNRIRLDLNWKYVYSLSFAIVSYTLRAGLA